ncbi:MAG: T9SS type A sorting domain-containing protein, partial [Saprospiraceae bacterium]
DIRYVNNTAYYDHDRTYIGASIGRDYNIPNTINCYWVANAGGSGVAAYAFLGGNTVVLGQKNVNENNTFWAHEMGHALALNHTFYGWEGYDHNFAANAPELVNYNRLVERVDRSNCAEAGDGFCDTSPDYLEIGQWQCNNESQSSYLQKDPTGASFRSDGTFIMSYAECSNRFSDEQIQAMRAHILTAKREFLAPQPSFAVLDTLTTEILFPQKGDTIAPTNVTLEWQAMPGATHYYVEMSRFASFPGNSTDTYLVDTNNLYIGDLVNNRTYYWRIKAYNDYSFCSPISPVASFRTATPDNTTSTDAVNAATHFKVFPNPARNNQALNIEIQALENTSLNLLLYDISGKILQTTRYDAIAGTQQLSFKTPHLPKGIYLLHVIADKINKTEKIIIQ